MPYTPYTWQIGVGGATPIDKTNLDHLETQYAEAIVSVVKTADQTVNNSVVLVNDTHLLFAIAANEVWIVKYYIAYISSNVADIKFHSTIPALAAKVAYEMGFGYLTNNSLAVIHGAAAQILFGGMNADKYAHFYEIIINGANAGNVQLQWAQVNAEVSDTKVLEGACIMAHKLA